jgi:hypothetical protein
MRRLVLVAVLAAAVAATALPGEAVNTKPQVVDSATDSTGGQAGLEIVSALWTTTGDTVVTKVRGHRVTQYTPLKSAPFYYETSASVAGCGTLRFTYNPGTVYSAVVSESFLWYDCGPGDDVQGPGLTLLTDVKMTFGAKSITWEYPIKALGKSVKVGAPVTEFSAITDVEEPVLGLYGPKDAAHPIDEGTGDVTWKLGS